MMNISNLQNYNMADKGFVLDCHHTAHIGQSSDQKQPAWVYEGQVLPE